MPAANDPRRFWSPKLAHTHLGRHTEPTEDDIAAAEDACRFQFIDSSRRGGPILALSNHALSPVRTSLSGGIETLSALHWSRLRYPPCRRPPREGGWGWGMPVLSVPYTHVSFPKNFATDSPGSFSLLREDFASAGPGGRRGNRGGVG